MHRETKMVKYIFMLVFAGFGLIFFTSCARQQKVFIPEKAKYDCECESNNIKISAKTIGKRDKTFPSSRNTLRKYQPIEIKIENNSDNSYVLEQKNIGLKIASVRDVARTMRRSLPFRLAALLLIDLFSLISLASILPPQMTGVAILLSCCSVLSTLPCTFLVIGYIGRDNAKISRKLRQNSIDVNGKIIISPNSEVRVLVFAVKKDFEPRFDLSLVNSTSDEELTFNIDLEDNLN